MALKFNKRVKFAYDYDWVEDDLQLSNRLKGKKEQAEALQLIKPKIWETIITQMGIDPFELPFVEATISDDLYKWLPWYDIVLRRLLPPLCDGAINGSQFSFKWMKTEDPDGVAPEYAQVRVNLFELNKVSEYYIMQVNIRRELIEGVPTFITKHRVLLYTSNF